MKCHKKKVHTEKQKMLHYALNILTSVKLKMQMPKLHSLLNMHTVVLVHRTEFEH